MFLLDGFFCPSLWCFMINNLKGDMVGKLFMPLFRNEISSPFYRFSDCRFFLFDNSIIYVPFLMNRLRVLPLEAVH